MYKKMKIYYCNLTGEVIYACSYDQDTKIDFDADYTNIKALNDRKKESISLLVLEDGQYSQDFSTCNGYKVEPTTKKLEFSYPDPNTPEVEPLYQKPLSETISENMDYLVDVDFRLSMVELGL